MELLELMRTRRSVRSYTDAPVSEEDITKILQAGLLSESGKAIRPWEFVLVENKETLHIYEKNIVHSIGGLPCRNALGTAGCTPERAATEETDGCTDADNTRTDCLSYCCANVGRCCLAA